MRRVGSHVARFEACSAFTRVTACLLAGSPERPFASKASAASLPPPPLRLLPAGATRVAGRDLHPLKIRAFSRRTQKPTASDVRLFRGPFATLRLWSRKTHFLRFPTRVDAA